MAIAASARLGAPEAVAFRSPITATFVAVPRVAVVVLALAVVVAALPRAAPALVLAVARAALAASAVVLLARAPPITRGVEARVVAVLVVAAGRAVRARALVALLHPGPIVEVVGASLSASPVLRIAMHEISSSAKYRK